MISIKRCAVAYWILGLCNNYGYVVMLSAAHDILARENGHEATTNSSFNPDRHCNQMSTGVILLADIIPSLLIKLVAPFTPLWMNFRMSVVVTTAAMGFILVAISNSLWVAVLGVICTSISSGLGETSLLSFTVFYHDNSVLSGWSSGTGGAGFFGALTYAGLLMIGLTPRETLFLLLIVPASMAISFWVILVSPLDSSIEPAESTHVNTPQRQQRIPQSINRQSAWSKLGRIPCSLNYILPLTLVYFFEYLINQGLSELCLFEKAFIDTKTQYRWYQVFYQIGVFFSRSSISLIQIDNLWLLAVFQGVNLAYFIAEAIYRFTPSLVIVLAVILWEGVLGGLSYVNTFHNIQKQVPPEDRETVTGITSTADSFGITLSGFTAIPLHDKICSLSF